MANLLAQHGQLTVNNGHWTTPLHVVNSNNIDGAYVINHTASPYHQSVDADQDGVSDALIPFVDVMWADPESDAHMIIIDPFEAVSWEFSRFHHVADYGQWESSTHARWDLGEQGYGEPFFGDSWWRQGCRGSGVPLIAGLVRPEEVEAGEIRHALMVSTGINAGNIDGTETDQLVRPACRTDAALSGPDYPLEGARIQLDPALDLDSLGLGESALVIARALQVYGAIDGDNASTFSLVFQPLDPDGDVSRQLWEARLPGMVEDIQTKIPVSAFRVLAYDEVIEH